MNGVTEGTPLRASAPLTALPAMPDPAAGLDLAPSPAGHDPRRRKPWGSRVFVDADGRPIRNGMALRQYLVDRDGHPILTRDRHPIHEHVDEQGQPVLDAEGRPTITAVEIPPGSQIQD